MYINNRLVCVCLCVLGLKKSIDVHIMVHIKNNHQIRMDCIEGGMIKESHTNLA